MTNNDVPLDDYFYFLSRIVAGDDKNFNLLLRYLYKIEFYSLIPNDDNRGEDGKKLREIYLDEEHRSEPRRRMSRNNEDPQGSFYLPEDPCTVLEMLIGLSYRMENELECGPLRTSARECFWLFLKNLGLEWVNNTDFYRYAADELIGSLLDRKYKKNGEGGIFPLKRTKKNQRKVEIWYQMQEYLLENYF
jgi:hypothetical protein